MEYDAVQYIPLQRKYSSEKYANMENRFSMIVILWETVSLTNEEKPLPRRVKSKRMNKVEIIHQSRKKKLEKGFSCFFKTGISKTGFKV